MRPLDGTPLDGTPLDSTPLDSTPLDSTPLDSTTGTTGTTAPARVWFSLLRRLGRGISGRRFTVRGTTFEVQALHGRPDGPGFSPGRVRDARAVLVDVEGPELTARRVVVTCETLTVRPTVTATGIHVTAVLDLETVRAMMAEAGTGTDVDVVDGEMRSRWLPGVDVVVRPVVHRDRLEFVPVTVISPVGRFPVLWLPSVSAPLPDLPGGLRLVEVGTTQDAVLLRATAAEWTASPRERTVSVA